MLQEFLTASPAKYNPATIKAYGTDIKQFVAYCNERKIVVTAVTQAQAIVYRDHIKSLKIAVSTQSRKLSALWAFFAWALSQKRVTVNPFDGVQVRRDKAQVRKRRTSVGEDFERLLSVIGLQDRSEARDRAVIRVMFDTKIRLRDLLTLNVADFDALTGTITYQGTHVVTKSTAAELRAYVASRPDATVSSPLFVNRGSERISDRSIRRRLAAHCIKAGITGLSPYAFSGTQKSSASG